MEWLGITGSGSSSDVTFFWCELFNLISVIAYYLIYCKRTRPSSDSVMENPRLVPNFVPSCYYEFYFFWNYYQILFFYYFE